MERDNPICISWSIKGYHAHRIKPPPEVTLNLQREPHNRFDRNAIVVKLPRLVQMTENEHDMECQARGGIVPLRQLAGQTVEHVPANLCL